MSETNKPTRTAAGGGVTMNLITPQHYAIMEHAVGYPKMYRNYYAADPESDNYALILELESAGYMKRGCSIPGGLIYFHVAESVVEAMNRKAAPQAHIHPPHTTPSSYAEKAED